MRKILILFALLLILSNLNFAQKIHLNDYDKPRDKFGIFGGVSFNSYNTDIIRLPDLPCCGKTFNDGSGIGFYGGMLYDHPFTEYIWLNIKLGYNDNSGKMVKTENVKANLNGNAVDAVFEQSIETGFSYIFLEPNVSFKVWKNLFVGAGLDFRYNVGKSYSQKEVILEPSTGYFENNLRERLVSSGDITKTTGFNLAINAGVYYDIPLNNKNEWYLSPEINYHYGLTDAIDNTNFQINYLNLGLGIKYSPFYGKKEEEPLRRDENIPSKLNIETLAYGVGNDSTIKPVVEFRVEEFLSNQFKPLISYVFFEENSSDIPERYHSLKDYEIEDFTVNSIKNNDNLEIYYDLLNIIGRRMIEHPESKITLEGCNSNLGDEKGNLDLSYKRALSVLKYLVMVWKIPEDRITIRKRNLPEEPSNSDEAEGIVENRRVEIKSNMFEIVAPVATSDTLRMVNPPTVRFFNNVKSEEEVKNWNLSAYQDGRLLKSFSGEGDVPNSLDWQFEHNQKSAPKSSSPVDYQLTVKDKSDNFSQTNIKSLSVDYVSIQRKKRERIKDKYIDRYDLIQFGFDNSKLTDHNSTVINLIKKDLKPTSVITVTGHTDKTGTADYNKKLSNQRAKIVADAFAPNKAIYKGVGQDNPMMTNDLPEGRFYNRFVEILVETTINE